MVNVIRCLDLSIFLVFTSIVSLSDGKRPDTLLCADLECKGIVSIGKTVIRYSAGDEDMISFQPNKDVRILGKSMDGKILKISYQGRDGFAPAHMIRESKMFVNSKDMVEVKGLAVETPQPSQIAAENATESPNQITDIPPSVADEKKDESILDPTVENEKNDASNEMDLKGEEEENLAEVMDEDEALEMEMEGKKPVVEEPFIKKDAYKVGEDGASVQPNLEVVGFEESFTKNTTSENKTKEVSIENVNTSAQASIENVSSENTNSVVVNEEKLPENSESEIVPTTPVPMEPDTKNMSIENIEPSETFPATQTPDNVPIKLDDNIVEYDGTKIDSKLLENDIEPTVTKELPILIEATAIPAPVVEQKLDSLPEETQVSVDNNETVESTLVAPMSTQTESKDINVNVPEIQNIPKATELTSNVDTNITSSNESIVKDNMVDGKTDDIAVNDVWDELSPVLNNTTPEEQSVTLKQDETIPRVSVPAQTVSSSSSPQPELPVEDVNLHGKSQEKQELPIISEPNIVQLLTPDSIQAQNSLKEESQEKRETQIDSEPNTNGIPRTHANWQEQQKTFTPSPKYQETLKEKPQQTEDIPIPITSEPPVVDVEKEKDMPIVDNTPDPDDIFSSNYKPDFSNIKTETDQGNWYDGILIGFEEIYDSVQGLFSSKSFDADISPHASDSQVNAVPFDDYCEKLEDGSCPKQMPTSQQSNLKNINYDQYADEFLKKVVAMSDVVFLLAFTGFCVLLFTLGHYWLANSKREKELIFKMNNVERNLLRTEKECSAVKEDLDETRKKLASIADKSFGTDDMIRQCENEKSKLREQIVSLKEELETAAEAGLELNKMVVDLLNNQSGSDSIISSVEELQRQLNEQEEATVYINNLLAEKSRENSELQVMLAESSQRFSTQIEELLKSNESLKSDKENLETELKETLYALEKELNADLEAKSQEINQLKSNNDDLQRKYEEIISRWQISTARADALEDSIKKIKELNGKDIKKVIEITNANAKLLAAQKESESLREELENEIDNKRRLEEQIKLINNEITELRADFNQNEKDKLEAQTRLDVLSSYFKEKEAQLQKELSVKEALFMKQQGESTSTVERVRSLQDEIQVLRSQNDQLRAEIEAQSAAHKAQINAAESRAHDSWLATKQAERRLEEAKTEAAVLRKRLTTLSLSPGVPENSLSIQSHALDGMIAHDAPSPIPIQMESNPGSPLMNLPLPPVFLPPPPLIGSNPSAFMPAPPPPLIPLPTHGEMRPAPLGRLMSPPPNNYVDDRGRYSPHRYSPDSRYDYGYSRDLYETETDFSPPRSPEPYRRERNSYRERNRDYSPSPPPQHQHKKRTSLGKGSVSSGSVDAPPQKHRGGKV